MSHDAISVQSERDQHAGEPIRVMLVDDQNLLRMGFRLILEGEEDMDIVAEAADGIEALEALQSCRGSELPHVVLMDVRMPRMDGIEATSKIVSQYPDVRVIILTTFDLDEYAFSGLQAGASAFLLKDVGPEELASAVRVVSEGDAVVAPRITQRLLDVYLRTGESLPGMPSPGEAQQPGQRAKSPAESAVPASEVSGLPSGETIAKALDDGVVREALTHREVEVLFVVAEGLSNAEIAGRFFLSEATVKTHVRRILTKLQLRDRVQAVVYAYQSGLINR